VSDAGLSIAAPRRRLWVLSELYYPEETSTGYLLTEIAEGLADDFDVRVLCSQPTYASRGLRAARVEVRHGVAVRRCISTTLDRSVGIFRIFNVLTLTASLLLAAVLRVRRCDCLLVVTNPPTLPFVAAIVARLRAAALLVLVHDVYPDVMIASRMISRDGVAARLLRWLSRRLYRTARRVIVLGRDMRRLVEGSMGVPASRIALIENWAHADVIHPTNRLENELLMELEILDRFVVQYAGNMGHTHDLECLALAIEKLRSDSEIHFLFVGSGAKKKWLETKVRELMLKNVTIVGSRPRSDQLNFLNACDIAITTFVSGMAGVSVPSRMYDIFAAGKPIIAVAADDSELATIVREERLGWVIGPGDVDAIVQAVIAARRQPGLLADMGRRARVVAERSSRAKALAAYRELVTGA
jgi:glycosyltransferase involved in cell wall biosynthesis